LEPEKSAVKQWNTKLVNGRPKFLHDCQYLPSARRQDRWQGECYLAFVILKNDANDK
jgi:hypothetical protein